MIRSVAGLRIPGMRWSPSLAPALLAGLALAGGLPAAGAAAPRTREVVIRDIDFTPHRVVVRRGDRVRWVWRDGPTAHNVTSRGRHRFRSAHTRKRGSYVVRFTRPGTYRFVCTLHFNMKGAVVVR